MEFHVWEYKILKIFSSKINILKVNYWILRIDVHNVEVSKSAKIDFQSQLYTSKIIGIFLNFFSLNDNDLEAQILVTGIFDNINF